MKTTISAALIAGAFALGACGGGGGSDASKYEKLTTEACACKDLACIDEVAKKRREFSMGLRKKYKKKEDAPKELVNKVEELDKEYRKCRRALRDKERDAKKAATKDGNTDSPPPTK